MRDLLWIVACVVLAVPAGYQIITLRSENQSLKRQIVEVEGWKTSLREEVERKSREIGRKNDEIRVARKEAADKMRLVQIRLDNALGELADLKENYQVEKEQAKERYEKQIESIKAEHDGKIHEILSRQNQDRGRRAVSPTPVAVQDKHEPRCPNCNGKGSVKVEKVCSACGGKGYTVETYTNYRGDGWYNGRWYTGTSPSKTYRNEHCCGVCKRKNSLDRRGTGRVTTWETCPSCGGRGVR